ncbi:MAG: hypothetical protein HQ564_00865 [Candidatus Saganbacteria bacterium]|nr:hypothetical protein [Candidatus Saganbacteria bacterium]
MKFFKIISFDVLEALREVKLPRISDILNKIKRDERSFVDDIRRIGIPVATPLIPIKIDQIKEFIEPASDWQKLNMDGFFESKKEGFGFISLKMNSYRWDGVKKSTDKKIRAIEKKVLELIGFRETFDVHRLGGGTNYAGSVTQSDLDILIGQSDFKQFILKVMTDKRNHSITYRKEFFAENAESRTRKIVIASVKSALAQHLKELLDQECLH